MLEDVVLCRLGTRRCAQRLEIFGVRAPTPSRVFFTKSAHAHESKGVEH
jgi:hypothetical protein